MRAVVLDAGALIGLERGAPSVRRFVEQATSGRLVLVVPRTVVAQVWRGGPRQAVLARLLRSGTGDGPVVIDELTARRAEQVGVAIGLSGHTDVVDVHVALVAGEAALPVVTSDAADILRVDPGLVVVDV